MRIVARGNVRSRQYRPLTFTLGSEAEFSLLPGLHSGSAGRSESGTAQICLNTVR